MTLIISKNFISLLRKLLTATSLEAFNTISFPSLILLSYKYLKRLRDGNVFEFISKNELTFFQGCVVKYVCRYLSKNKIEDLEKIKHYCDLEIKKLKDTK